MESGCPTALPSGTLPVNPFCETEGGIVTVTDWAGEPLACPKAVTGAKPNTNENPKTARLVEDIVGMMKKSETLSGQRDRRSTVA